MLQIAILVLVHAVLPAILSLRLLYRNLAVNTTLAWIIVLFALPLVGPALYGLFGDHSVGRRRLKHGPRIRSLYQRAYQMAGHDAAPAGAIAEPFDAFARSVAQATGFPVLARNRYEILTEAGEILARMRADIDRARTACLLEFYIIDPRGQVEAVLEAVLRAAARGVTCKILVDDFGGKPFFRSDWPARLRAAKVEVVRSLPIGLIKSISKRSDLRNHRKLLLCDRSACYMGSFNLVDPALFKSDSQVGEWVDVMMRIEGEMVDAFTCLFDTDFLFDSPVADFARTDIRALAPGPRNEGSPEARVMMQLLPSGPEIRHSTIYEFIVAAIFNARRRVRIATPYFIPDQAIVLALTSAAKRGVKVEIIVPARLDTRLGQYASQAAYEELLSTGVVILRYGDGLLHTKAVLIDDGLTVFGTANMDMRSFDLNLEVSLIAYERALNAEIDAVLDGYAARSAAVDAAAWAKRPPTQRFLENLIRLAGPLL